MQESGQAPHAVSAAPGAVPGTQEAPVSAAVAPTSKAKSSIGALFADLLLYAVVSAVVSVLMIKFAPQILGDDQKANTTNIVVVDVEAIAREHVVALGEKVRDGSIPVDQMAVKTKEFSKAMIDQFHGYARQGMIVLNTNAVASIPDDIQDLTETIQAQLKKDGYIEERKPQNADGQK